MKITDEQINVMKKFFEERVEFNVYSFVKINDMYLAYLDFIQYLHDKGINCKTYLISKRTFIYGTRQIDRSPEFVRLRDKGTNIFKGAKLKEKIEVGDDNVQEKRTIDSQ